VSLTLANGFTPCASTSADTYASIQLSRRLRADLATRRAADLPFAMQMTATYLGVKGSRGVQESLPNTYPIGAAIPAPLAPWALSIGPLEEVQPAEAGQVQLRRRLRAGFTASLLYTYSKSIDDDAFLAPGPH